MEEEGMMCDDEIRIFSYRLNPNFQRDIQRDENVPHNRILPPDLNTDIVAFPGGRGGKPFFNEMLEFSEFHST